MNSYFDPVTLEKMLRENGYLSGSKQKYTRENTVYQYTEEDFKTRLAQGTAADKTIFNFIRSGKADAFLMEKLGYHLKYKANQIFANMDIMSKEVNDMAEVSSLYETAGAGMTQVYMKNFVSALWIIRCVVDKQKPDEILFDGLKSLVKRKEGDDYIFDLMNRIFPRKRDNANTKQTTVKEQSPEMHLDNEFDKRIEDIEKRVYKHEERLETLELNTQESNNLVHNIRNAFEKTDKAIRKIYKREEARVLLTNNDFLIIMQKAVEQGFCQPVGWQFKWQRKYEAAYFASNASQKFGLSERKDHDGDITISWKPFEALFNEEDLRLSYNDIQQCKVKVNRKEEIDKLFK